jgi:hypothetical protein
MKGLSELRTKNGVNDGIQRRVEAAHPPKEGDEVWVKLKVLEDGHHECKDEKREPAGNERARHDSQRLGRLPFALCLQAHVFLLLPEAGYPRVIAAAAVVALLLSVRKLSNDAVKDFWCRKFEICLHASVFL